MSRIAQRSAPYERLIDRAYMEKLGEAYARYFYSYDDSPLLIVNASAIDPVRVDADYEALFEQVNRINGGRHFYNPAAAVAFA
jgi:deoxyadenosine/deoxycytidine kinase